MKARRPIERGRVALVTGGSRGLGRAIAERLAGKGWQVFTAARGALADPTKLEPQLADGAGGALFELRADVRDEASIQTAVCRLLELTDGRLDAVVANAGIAAVGRFEDTPPNVIAEMMDTNYFGVLNTARHTLPALRSSRGRLLVMSSDSGAYGSPGLAGYTASKFALEGWAESIAYELRPCGVQVLIIRPGAFRSAIWQGPVYRGDDKDAGHLGSAIAAEWRQAAARAGDPVNVAMAVERLLTRRRPRLRHTVGADARRAVVLRRVLPEQVFAQVVGLPYRRSQRPGGS